MKEFRRISQITDHILPQSSDPPASEIDQQSLLEFWRKHAGIAAPHAFPFLYQSGRLVVFCDSAVWATQIRHQTPSLIRQLNESGYKISDLTPKVKPTDAIANHNSKPRKAVNPISSQNAKAMKSISAQLTHQGLRKALYRLAHKSENP